MKSRNRKRARVVVLDLAQLEPILAMSSPMGQAASVAGLKLVSARAFPCADGTITLRAVWRDRRGPVQTSMAETIRGLRLTS